jgi:hypothetical protein
VVLVADVSAAAPPVYGEEADWPPMTAETLEIAMAPSMIHDFGAYHGQPGTPSKLPPMEFLPSARPSAYPLPIDAQIKAGNPQSCQGGVVKDISVYKDCEVIEGFLAIVNSDIEDVNDLLRVRSIVSKNGLSYGGASLAIIGNKRLKGLRGLRFLAGNLDGSILIADNPKLAHVSGLEAISSVGTDINGVSISILRNKVLHNINGIAGLSGMLKGSVHVIANENLRNINGLNGLASIGADSTKTSILLMGNDALVHTDGLQRVTALEGSIDIRGNTNLEEINGMTSVAAIGANNNNHAIIIGENPMLHSIVGLSNVAGHLQGAVQIFNNAKLTSLKGLQHIVRLEKDDRGVSLEVSNCAVLSEVPKLGLQKTQGGIAFTNCPALPKLDFLGGLSEVGVANNGRSFELVDCNGITEAVLPAVSTMTGSALFQNNKKVEKIGVPQISTIGREKALGRSVEIMNNPKLTSMDFFSLKTTAGSIAIVQNRKLTNVMKFPVLNSIGCNLHGNSLEVVENMALLHFTGLDAVETLECSLIVERNAALQSFKGLDQVKAIKGASDIGDMLSIYFNDHLESIAALKKVKGDAPGAISIDGNPALNNLDGLNNILNCKKPNVYGNCIEIVKNTGMTDLTGLEGLKGKLNGAVEIVGNAIENVDAMKGVYGVIGSNTVGDSLSLVGNKNLTNIDGLTNLGGNLVGGLVIAENRILEQITAGLEGNNPIQTAAHVQVGGVLCITQHDVEYLSQLCTDFSCHNSIQNMKKCAKDCKTTPWGEWAGCTHSCGGGHQHRTRIVISYAENGGAPCPILSDMRHCNTEHCVEECQVSEWTDFGECSTSCGGGLMWRKRTLIKHGKHFACPALEEQRACQTDPCPQDCVMTMWSSYDDCTVSCGVGQWTRTRSMDQPSLHGGVPCPHDTTQTVACDNGPCPVDCDVSDWGVFSDCSRSCDRGTHFRIRRIVKKGDGASVVCPSLSQVRECNVFSCPVDCVLHDWKEWSTCSKSCDAGKGPGVQTRFRYVAVPAAFGGAPCGETEGTRMCNTDACPVDCQVSGWSEFSTCDKTCGWGHKKRTREVILSADYGGNPCPELTEVEQCNIVPCPVKGKTCKMSKWSTFSVCSLSCGGGKKSQHRSVLDRNGQDICPHVNREKDCNTQPCPEDCEMGDWDEWTQCSKTCGEKGRQSRHRRIVKVNSDGGKPCQTTTEHEDCNMGPCPIHCEVSPWTKFSDCTKSCGSGSYTRTRTITKTAQHGGFVCPSLKEVEVCQWIHCPVNCQMGDWGEWSVCTKSCAKGVHHRSRKILVHPQHGGEPCGNVLSMNFCNTQPCPIDCVLSDWSAFSECSHTCLRGLKRRSRIVMTEATHGGRHCSTHRSQTRECDAGPCPVNCRVSLWGHYGPCSASCGTGSKTRTRTVQVLHDPNGAKCPALKDIQECNTNLCPVNCMVGNWSKWQVGPTNWQGHAQMIQTREIIVRPWAGGKKCPIVFRKKSWVSHCLATSQQHEEYGKWSECDSTSKKYRFRVHVKCVHNAVIRMHMKYRQTAQCTPGEMQGTYHVVQEAEAPMGSLS